MKVTYSWLKKFVDLRVSPQKLAEGLTMAGLEVVALEKHGDDFVLEIEITSNRPDWLSILGVAREVSAIYGLKLKAPVLLGSKSKSATVYPVKVSIANQKDCPFYSARIISDLQVATSPQWLQKSLEALGCRSVNNIVDITNYCLFEFGQPLHAFDLDKLHHNAIKVRRAESGEKIITLDGQTRILDPQVLVIADADRPVAIAGIMGGAQTEVTAKTCNILLESAVFNPVLVRRAKQKLGLQSESAYRFERGVDLGGVSQAAQAAQEMILKLAGGKPGGIKSAGTDKVVTPAINLEIAYLNKLLGTAISVLEARRILNRLGLSAKAKYKDTLTVVIPSFRQDLKTPVDLVEEVARIYGYGKISQTLPAVKPVSAGSGQREIVGQIKSILSGLGLNEAITYSLVDRSLLKQSGINLDSAIVAIANPLSKEQEVLRPALWPSLVRGVAYNLNQQQEQVSIFEVASAFTGQSQSVEEEPLLSIALCGSRSFFTKNGLVKDELTLLHLKGILETLLSRLGIKSFDLITQPNRQINILINQKPAGFLLELAPHILQTFDIKNRQVVLAQLSLKRLFEAVDLGKRFREIPKYPAIIRDISFVINEDFSVKELLEAIKASGQPLLNQAKIVDYYQGKQIPPGFRGLTVSCLYRQDNRTLTEEEVTPVHDGLCSLLTEKFGIKLR
jgi:phenylalanyl-tRNA synthetase beta chain